MHASAQPSAAYRKSPSQGLASLFQNQMICCVTLKSEYVATMDWQQCAALGIVAATAVGFAVSKLRGPRVAFARNSHCGCSTASTSHSAQSIVFRARKG